MPALLVDSIFSSIHNLLMQNLNPSSDNAEWTRLLIEKPFGNDIESAKRQKFRLLQQERTGIPVILYADETTIKHEFTDKLPITNFPLKNSDMKDAPVVIYEFPVDTPPYGLYVAGVDPYRQGKSAYSSSLGAVYVYKRMHEITGEKYQDMFVASYVARPDKKETWEEQALSLIHI